MDNILFEQVDADSTDEKVQGMRGLNAWLKGCDEMVATIVQNAGAKEYDGMLVTVAR